MPSANKSNNTRKAKKPSQKELFAASKAAKNAVKATKKNSPPKKTVEEKRANTAARFEKERKEMSRLEKALKKKGKGFGVHGGIHTNRLDPIWIGDL
jgi:hypothetical protein